MSPREPGATSLTDAWAARVRREPSAPALAYFDGRMTVREVDQATDALAAGFAAYGVQRGDRVGLHLQNIPQYPLAFIALWKLGATALLLNPMYKGHELRHLTDDSGAVGVVCDVADAATIEDAVADSAVKWVLGTSQSSFQTRNDPRVFPEGTPPQAATRVPTLESLMAEHQGASLAPVACSTEDVALLTYTSGTTGPPKGAMNTHGNVLAATATFAAWTELSPGDVVFAMAPMFHITGAVINAAIALMQGAVLVLPNRFHPEVALDAFVEHGVTFTIGSITAFNALRRVPHAGKEHFASFKAVYSGGAPIPPATVEALQDRFGVYVHNAYGMTETTSAVVAVPRGAVAPVDPRSGALSVGKALPGTYLDVVDTTGVAVAPGDEGELVIRGPQVVPGYWEKPDATAHTMPDGHLRTGDGAVIDGEGWVYLVDRIKDQINSSGYKVWPREVEDALTEHPAVDEVAVVGQPDEYRGEKVVAYVSLANGMTVSADELVAHVRERLAAYKCPREIHFVPELPRTQTGKIRRADLRQT